MALNAFEYFLSKLTTDHQGRPTVKYLEDLPDTLSRHRRKSVGQDIDKIDEVEDLDNRTAARILELELSWRMQSYD